MDTAQTSAAEAQASTNTDGLSMLREELARLQRENQALRGSLERAEGLAYRDALTGLRNRRYFDERAREELARLKRVGGEPLSVILLDLDGFKQINDTRGHLAGDQALVWVAEFLNGQIRFTDVCCRLGGDEFALLLPDTGARGCEVLCEHLRTRLAEATLAGTAPVSFSLGCSTSKRVDDARALVSRADAAMYESKRSRSGRKVLQIRPARATGNGKRGPAEVHQLFANG
jgi:diguanylate cyclase (GGDEF)-like protein